MSKYLVKLKPVDSFSLGRKVLTFMMGKTTQNNIVKSREFPQQTSILGMIRKEILVLNSCIREKWDYSKDQQKKIIS